jgi:hypothetical protein
MVKVYGSADIRAGTSDYKRWQLLEEDGVTVKDLTTVTSVTLRIQHVSTAVVTEYATDDVSPKLFVTDAANGTVQFRPGGTLATVGEYRFHFFITSAAGDHPIPEGYDYTLRVIDQYAPP